MYDDYADYDDMEYNGGFGMEGLSLEQWQDAGGCEVRFLDDECDSEEDEIRFGIK